MAKKKKFDPFALQADIGRAGLTIKEVLEEADPPVHQNTFTNWKKKDGFEPAPDVVKRVEEAFERLKKKNG